MKKIYLFILIFLVIILGVYLNRSYAFIYNSIQNGNLTMFENNKQYIINENIQTSKAIVYTVLGDSLTAGAGVDNYEQSFVYGLAEKISKTNNEKVVLQSRAILGYNSVDLKNVLLPLAISDKPDIITILIGVNDIHNFVSKKDFENNYNEILSKLIKETKAKIYVINIPYIGSKNLILPPYNLYFDSQTKEYNKIIKNLADKYQVNYVDLYTESLKDFQSSNSYYSKDLFHPSAKGYALWANIIYANFNK